MSGKATAEGSDRGVSVDASVRSVETFYEQSARPAGPKITLLFPHLYICASALITCAIITSRTLLPCDLTSRLRQFRRLLSIAAMSSLPQLRLRDGYRDRDNIDTTMQG